MIAGRSPGADREFSYPNKHPENQALSTWWSKHGPLDVHINLHGMSLSDGAMLLIEPAWADRCEPLKAAFRDIASGIRLDLHHHDRHGEKGFDCYGAGFTSTPRAARCANS